MQREDTTHTKQRATYLYNIHIHTKTHTHTRTRTTLSHTHNSLTHTHTHTTHTQLTHTHTHTDVGFKLAPAVGSILARLVTGEHIDYDMSLFAINRVLRQSSHL